MILNEKTKELLDYLETYKYIPTQRTITETVTIRKAGHYLAHNRETIIAELEEYRKYFPNAYPVAYKLIMQDKEKHLQFQEKYAPMEEKLKQFIELANIREFHFPSELDPYHTKNIEDLKNFWSLHAEKIYLVSQELVNNEKYKNATNSINNFYQNYIRSKKNPEKKKQQINEFIDKVNVLGKIPPQVGSFKESTANIESIGIFWQGSIEEIYNEIIKRKNDHNYKVAYDVITKSYENYHQRKQENTSPQEKYHEFFSLLEENDSFSSSIKKLTTKHISSIGSYWHNHRNKLYDIANNNLKFISTYPKACNLIKEEFSHHPEVEHRPYTFKEKIISFITYVENNSCLPSKNNNFHNELINNFYDFWKNNLFKIHEEVNKQQKQYPNAYKLIEKEYQNKQNNLNQNVSIETKITDFFEYVRDNKNIPSTKAKVQYKTIANVGSFWRFYNEKIIKQISLEANHQKYPQVYDFLLEENEKFIQSKRIPNSNKYQALFEYLESGGSFQYVKNGKYIKIDNIINNVGAFWYDNMQGILEEIEKQQKIYPKAYKKIQKKYQSYLSNVEKQKVSIDKKILEYITWLENPEHHKLINITNQESFWNSHKEKIYSFFSLDNCRKEKYPKAFSIIENKYQNYKSSTIPMNIKIENFLKYINTTKTSPITKEPINSCDTINDIGRFWGNNKEKIYAVAKEKQDIYPNAFEILSKIYDSRKTKIIEFLNYINNPSITSLNVKMYSKNILNIYGYWQSQKDHIYELFLLDSSLKETYPHAYSLVIKMYQTSLIKTFAIIESWSDKKTTEQIQAVCQANNINYDKYNSILEHITYKELVAKIEFLKVNNLPLEENNHLHEIFTMSSINMEAKYNISLADLINKYFVITKNKIRVK